MLYQLSYSRNHEYVPTACQTPDYHAAPEPAPACLLLLRSWPRRLDSTQRPPGPKPGALPDCAAPRLGRRNEVYARFAGHASAAELAQPNRPVTYSSVRGSVGLVKIRSVGATSMTSPSRKNAVVSLMRAACCMLWVTKIGRAHV